jgi:manganese oxidase
MPQIRGTFLWPALAAVLALFLAVSVGLQLTSSEAAATGDHPSVVGANGTTGATDVDISLGEWFIEPTDVTVAAGAPITFNVSNDGAIPHDLTIVDVDETPELAGGEEATLELADGLDAGMYRMICSIPGHESAGMTGTLTVDDGGGAVHASDHEDTGATTMTPEEMVRHHDEGVENFLAGYGGEVYGNNLLEPTVDDDGALVFELTAEEIEWETKPGVLKQGMAFNGQIPGPMIRAEVGDTIKIVLNNEMSVPTAIHPHGLLVPNDMDGVPSVTQDAVMPGETFVYEIPLRNAGSHMYHSHFDSATQVPAGLLGALIVDDPERPVAEDVDYTMILNDGPLGYTINGKDFPATEPIVVNRGDQVRVRFMNEGLQIHPMHLHGMPMTVIEKDGYPLPQPYMLDTLNVAPGDRYDVVIDAEEPGAWAFHCHILTHAEGPDGMFGMVTALVVQE